MNYSISFEIEFTTRTIAGHTECRSSKEIYRDFKDYDVVEETVNYFYKLFTKNDFHHIEVTVDINKDYSRIDCFNRLCRDYSQSDGELIVWHNKGNATDIFNEQKITKKYIREWYLNIVDRLYIDYIDNPAVNVA